MPLDHVVFHQFCTGRLLAVLGQRGEEMTQWPSPPPIKQAKIICIGSQLKFSFKHWCWYWPSIALFRMGASLEHIGREFALKLWFWLPQRQSFHSCAFLSCVCVCNLFVPSGLTICCSSSRFNFGLMFFHPWERPVITTKRCMKSAHAHTITTHTRTRARTPLTTPGWCIIIVLCPLPSLLCSIYSSF